MTEDNFGDFLRFFLCEFVTVLTKVTARGFLEKFLKLNLHNLYTPKLPQKNYRFFFSFVNGRV